MATGRAVPLPKPPTWGHIYGTLSDQADLVAVLDSLATVAYVDAAIAAIDGLTAEDIDTLAEINAVLTDANLASVSYVDGLAANYATAAQGALADSALQPGDITSGTITPGTGDIDFDALGGGGVGGSTGATDNRLLRSDGTGGATLQPTGITVDDANAMTGIASITADACTFGLNTNTYSSVRLRRNGAVVGGLSTASSRLTLFGGSVDTASHMYIGSDGKAVFPSMVGFGLATTPETNLHVKGQTYPIAIFERVASNTSNVSWSSLVVRATDVSREVADGFGVSLAFEIEDATSGDQTLMTLGATRQGADNTGSFQIDIWKLGVKQEAVFAVTADGGVHASGGVSAGPVTFAVLNATTATATLGTRRITDRGNKLAYPDGTNWRFVGDDAIIS